MTVLSATLRKLRQLTEDPVLRRWLVGRLLGRWPGEPPYQPHRPPYLSNISALPPGPVAADFAELPAAPPREPLALSLAGQSVTIEPGDEVALFDRQFDDIEDYLALHRFAWLPVAGDDIDPAWFGALWKAWRNAHGTPDAGWSWHPYTAGERLVNVIGYGRRHGLPAPLADTLAVLGRHGPAIFERLEYFGEHNTGNHLANNGRALFLGGLALGIDDWAGIGGDILCSEARRIFSASGVLKEGSSHYHLLLARSYAECWLAAKATRRPETDALAAITAAALSVIPALSLPGGLPLIGDISPDCPPRHLGGLIDTDSHDGWIGLLAPSERQALLDLMAGTVVGDPRPDGWLRADIHDWTGLWHCAPGGWPHMPGHGHQDCGAFELHYGGEAVFIDAGRGAYGEVGEAARYRAAGVHNTLTIDGADPYPANRPYYNDAFRRAIGGPPPVLERRDNIITLRHGGYGRLPGGGDVLRTWSLKPGGLGIIDQVAGRGRHRVRRNLVTALAVTQEGEDIVIAGRNHTFRVSGDVRPEISTITAWQAYGQGVPATSICFNVSATLPWQGHINVSVD